MKISFTITELNQKQIQYLINKDIWRTNERKKVFEKIGTDEKELDKHSWLKTKEWEIVDFSNEELITFLKLKDS